MGYWPRKRVRREYARVRHYPKLEKIIVLGFAGYKAGMTHLLAIDNRKESQTKGTEIFVPATVIECPPIKVASIRFYKKTPSGLVLSSEIFSKVDSELSRRIPVPKKDSSEKLKVLEGRVAEFSDIRLNVYTQPKLTGFGKKKPELFETAVGGNSVNEKLNYAKSVLGKELKVSDIIAPGSQLDIHATTKGKGFQGPVKRFGVSIRAAKSEKTKRGPGNVGPWTGNRSWTVSHAGQMGYHLRTEKNKVVLLISDKPERINPKGGFVNYGFVKQPFVLIKGSVQGPAKRLLRFTPAGRPDRKLPSEAPNITYISQDSHQG